MSLKWHLKYLLLTVLFVFDVLLMKKLPKNPYQDIAIINPKNNDYHVEPEKGAIARRHHHKAETEANGAQVKK